jgi:hypothetical protein
MIWTAYLSWAKLDPTFYGRLPFVDRWEIFRHTVRTGIAVHYGRPVRKWIRQRMPAWMLLRRLELVGRRADGLGWYRATDDRSARHLADVQPDSTRGGHAILREGEMLLLDRRGHIRGFVILDEDECIVETHDGTDWSADTPEVWAQAPRSPEAGTEP